jgi:hypothetical protein
MIKAIIKYAGDEFESPADYIELAMASDEQLVDKLIGILEFYHTHYNEQQ